MRVRRRRLRESPPSNSSLLPTHATVHLGERAREALEFRDRLSADVPPGRGHVGMPSKLLDVEGAISGAVQVREGGVAKAVRLVSGDSLGTEPIPEAIVDLQEAVIAERVASGIEEQWPRAFGSSNPRGRPAPRSPGSPEGWSDARWGSCSSPL